MTARAFLIAAATLLIAALVIVCPLVVTLVRTFGEAW